jgi:hypothetical protein
LDALAQKNGEARAKRHRSRSISRQSITTMKIFPVLVRTLPARQPGFDCLRMPRICSALRCFFTVLGSYGPPKNSHSSCSSYRGAGRTVFRIRPSPAVRAR